MGFNDKDIGGHIIRGPPPKETRLARMVCENCGKETHMDIYTTIEANRICPVCKGDLKLMGEKVRK